MLDQFNPFNSPMAQAMIGYQPQNVPALPEGQMPNPAAPVIRNDPQPGMFGGLGFQPMSAEGLAGLGITNPMAMEFRTPRYDQPFTPFGMHTLDPFGYNQQFPPVSTTPNEPDIGGPGPTPDPRDIMRDIAFDNTVWGTLARGQMPNEVQMRNLFAIGPGGYNPFDRSRIPRWLSGRLQAEQDMQGGG